MSGACFCASDGGNLKTKATPVESPGNTLSDAGSIPAISTTQKSALPSRKPPEGAFLPGFSNHDSVSQIKSFEFQTAFLIQKCSIKCSIFRLNFAQHPTKEIRHFLALGICVVGLGLLVNLS